MVFSSADGREENAIGLPYLNDRKYAYIDEKGNIIEETKSVYFIQVAEFESASVVKRFLNIIKRRAVYIR